MTRDPAPVSEREHRFIELYEAHYDELHAFCARRVGADHAADTTAEVFMVAWRRIDGLDVRLPRAWLFGVARGVIRNAWRANRRRNRVLEKVLSQRQADVSQPDQMTEQAHVDNEILAAFEKLSRADREILRLSAWDQLTGPEIAAVLDLSISAVHKRLSRAKSRLARQLDNIDSTLTTQGRGV